MNSTTQSLYCDDHGFIDNLNQEFKDIIEAEKDCECVQEFLSKYPDLREHCECNSCFHIEKHYPHCKCDPWTTKINESWYAPQRYEYLKCYIINSIDFESMKIANLLV